MISATIEAIEGREWPRTEAEIHLLRSAMFTAQAIIRDMERAGREAEIEEISRNISEVAPELPGKSANDSARAHKLAKRQPTGWNPQSDRVEIYLLWPDCDLSCEVSGS